MPLRVVVRVGGRLVGSEVLRQAVRKGKPVDGLRVGGVRDVGGQRVEVGGLVGCVRLVPGVPQDGLLGEGFDIGAPPLVELTLCDLVLREVQLVCRRAERVERGHRWPPLRRLCENNDDRESISVTQLSQDESR